MQVYGRRRTGQLTVVHKAAARPQQLQTGLERSRSNRIKHNRCPTAARMFTNCGLNILGGAVNHIGCTGSSYCVYSLAARDADHMCSAASQKRHEHSTDRARGAPNDRRATFYRPNPDEAPGGQPGDCQASAILEAKTIGDWR